jgi:hypothetical protein
VKHPREFASIVRARYADEPFPEPRDGPAIDFMRNLALTMTPVTGGLYREAAPNVATIATLMAMLAALDRRVTPDRRCPHVGWKTSEDLARGGVAALTVNAASCSLCMSRERQRWLTYEPWSADLCDVCEEVAPDNIFTETTTPAVALIMVGCLCDSCVAWSRGQED